MGKSTVNANGDWLAQDECGSREHASGLTPALRRMVDIAVALERGDVMIDTDCRGTDAAQALIWRDCGMLVYLRETEQHRPHAIVTRPPRLRSTELVREVGDVLYTCIRSLDKGGALCLLLDPGVDEYNYCKLLGLIGGVGEVARMHNCLVGAEETSEVAVLLGVRDEKPLPKMELPYFEWVESDEARWHLPVVREELLAAIVASICPINGRVADPFARDGSILCVAKALGRHAFGHETEPGSLKQAAARGVRVGSLFTDELAPAADERS